MFFLQKLLLFSQSAHSVLKLWECWPPMKRVTFPLFLQVMQQKRQLQVDLSFFFWKERSSLLHLANCDLCISIDAWACLQNQYSWLHCAYMNWTKNRPMNKLYASEEMELEVWWMYVAQINVKYETYFLGGSWCNSLENQKNWFKERVSPV